MLEGVLEDRPSVPRNYSLLHAQKNPSDVSSRILFFLTRDTSLNLERIKE